MKAISTMPRIHFMLHGTTRFINLLSYTYAYPFSAILRRRAIQLSNAQIYRHTPPPQHIQPSSYHRHIILIRHNPYHHQHYKQPCIIKENLLNM